jgi:hypothetical protein
MEEEAERKFQQEQREKQLKILQEVKFKYNTSQFFRKVNLYPNILLDHLLMDQVESPSSCPYLTQILSISSDKNFLLWKLPN